MNKHEEFDNLHYIYVPCPICGNDSYQHLIRLGYNQRFQYVRCKMCSVIYTNPKLVYNQNFINLAYGDDFHIIKRLKRIWGNNIKKFINDVLKSDVIIFRYKFMEKYVKSGNFLDIGCATGGYLVYGQHHGWNTYGIEICKPLYEFCKKKLNLKVYNKQLIDVKFKAEMFDAITLFQVIEHFDKPIPVLKEIYRILKPGGIVLIETPNCDALETKFKRLLIKLKLKIWHMAKGHTQEHFFEFNLKSFKYICKKVQFKILYAHTYTRKNNTDRLSLRHLLNLGTKYRFIIQK